MKFDKLQPGMVLYDVHREKMGNTTMRSIGVWAVRVLSVDMEKRVAMCSWNGNRPQAYYERGIEKLKEKEPILIRCGMGQTYRPTREERKAIVASGIEKTTFRSEEVRQLMQAHGGDGSPARQEAEPDGQDLNPVSVKDLSASASPATKEQQ